MEIDAIVPRTPETAMTASSSQSSNAGKPQKMNRSDRETTVNAEGSSRKNASNAHDNEVKTTGDSTNGRSHKVVSVSPASAGAITEVKTDMPDTDSILLSPRVLDEHSVTELSNSIRELIDSAREESNRLRDTIDQIAARESQATKSARQLHERLSLGARMLKAFQAQIERVDLILEAAGRREEQVEKLEAALDTKINSFEAKLDELVNNQIKKINAREEHLTQLVENYATRLEKVSDTSKLKCKEREAQIDGQIDKIEHAQEAFQNRLDANSNAVQKIESTVRDAHGVIKQTREARNLLAEELLNAADKIDHIQNRSTPLLAKLVLAAERTEKAATEIELKLSDAQRASKDFQALSAVGTEIDRLVTQLEPWAPILLREMDTVITERAQHITNGVRQIVHVEIKKLADSLRYIANGAESITADSAEAVAFNPANAFSSDDEPTADLDPQDIADLLDEDEAA